MVVAAPTKKLNIANPINWTFQETNIAENNF